MNFKFAKTDKVRLHYVFGVLDYIEVPAIWRYDIKKQKETLVFIMLYQKWQYLQEMLRSKNNELIEYAEKCFIEQLEQSQNIDDLFKACYPSIFNYK